MSHKEGTSLVVQWLNSGLPMQAARIRSLVRELDPTCCKEEFRCQN